MDLEQVKNKYILWASQKTESYGQYVFWKKKACGYTSVLENMEIYDTLDSAMSAACANCYHDVIPIKIEDVIPYIHIQTTFNDDVEQLLFEKRKQYKEKWQ